MPTDRSRLIRRIVPLVLIVAALVLITLSVRAEAAVGPVQRTWSDTTLPLHEVARRATRPVRDAVAWFGDLRTARIERDRLVAENAALRDQLATQVLATQDAEELRGLLDYVRSDAFPALGDFSPRAARVVARAPSAAVQSVVIDAGAAAGVQIGDPVLAGVGDSARVGGAALVGRIATVGDRTATVALLSAPDSAVGALVAGRRGADGILQPSAADPSVLVMGFVRRSSVVRGGDRVVTSGFLGPRGDVASAFPRGLPIGVVSEARQSDTDTYKNVLVVPWIDLAAFANVVVLTREPS